MQEGEPVDMIDSDGWGRPAVELLSYVGVHESVVSTNLWSLQDAAGGDRKHHERFDQIFRLRQPSPCHGEGHLSRLMAIP